MSAVPSFEWDVAACGVPLGDVRGLGERYERALQRGICADWIELYVGTFVTLLRNAHCTRCVGGSSALRLMQFLSDDLGTQLFDQDALRELERALLQSAA